MVCTVPLLIYIAEEIADDQDLPKFLHPHNLTRKCFVPFWSNDQPATQPYRYELRYLVSHRSEIILSLCFSIVISRYLWFLSLRYRSWGGEWAEEYLGDSLS